MVDCDMYVSARESLEFCAATLSNHAYVFFDDWHANDLAARNLGERRAFAEFLKDHPEFEASRCPDLRYNDNCEVYHVTRLSGQGFVGTGSRIGRDVGTNLGRDGD